MEEQHWRFCGVRSLSLSVQRIRYPPFEPSQMDPSQVPAMEVVIESDMLTPKFKIGADDDWFIEWKEFSEEFSHLPVIECQIGDRAPDFIDRTRRGWYIIPDPLHAVSRSLIPPTVILLIISLFIHAIEPVLVAQDIISKSFAGSFKFGPLYYPKLLFIAFPIFLLPLLYRMIANMRDMRRQKLLLTRAPADLEMGLRISRNRVAITTLPDMPDEVAIRRARVQVGVAVPERGMLIRALGRSEGGQPAPGMSTKLPEKRVNIGDEIGTGVGEATPMQLPNSRVTTLEPLRASEYGEWSEMPQYVDGQPLEWFLELPKGQWPGSIYSPLIAVHWELVIECKAMLEKDSIVTETVNKDDFAPDVMWVQPITMDGSVNRIVSDYLPVRSGRVELSGY